MLGWLFGIVYLPYLCDLAVLEGSKKSCFIELNPVVLNLYLFSPNCGREKHSL